MCFFSLVIVDYVHVFVGKISSNLSFDLWEAIKLLIALHH